MNDRRPAGIRSPRIGSAPTIHRSVSACPNCVWRSADEVARFSHLCSIGFCWTASQPPQPALPVVHVGRRPHVRHFQRLRPVPLDGFPRRAVRHAHAHTRVRARATPRWTDWSRPLPLALPSAGATTGASTGVWCEASERPTCVCCGSAPLPVTSRSRASPSRTSSASAPAKTSHSNATRSPLFFH